MSSPSYNEIVVEHQAGELIASRFLRFCYRCGTPIVINVATIGWNEMPDISKIDNKETLKELYLKFHPNHKRMRIVRMVG